ncbi:MAG: VWA domain-containing protein, partial [Bdellovibrionales bacterium]|nr:VWA domain-containing protein [Bdellovibrionales bacterium]
EFIAPKPSILKNETPISINQKKETEIVESYKDMISALSKPADNGDADTTSNTLAFEVDEELQSPAQSQERSKTVLKSVIGALEGKSVAEYAKGRGLTQSPPSRDQAAAANRAPTESEPTGASGGTKEKRQGMPLPPPQAIQTQDIMVSERVARDDASRFSRLPAPGLQGGGIEQTRERYAQYTENSPTFVTSDPVSTFSIDVDTGSYTNARRFLSQGTKPPKDSVRIEEFLNYFHYSYPAPKDEPFGLTYEIAPNPFETEKFILRLGIKARENRSQVKPWNLVFLIDVSGSMMDQSKLPLVKQALTLLVKNMSANDRVSIVTYAGYSGIALAPTGGDDKERAISVIQSLGAGGSTHGSAGIDTAYRLAKESFVPGGVNRVILTTDGDFNVGTTDQSALVRLIEEKRESGVSLTTIGVGSGNYYESMMEQLANKGNGNYFYLDSFKEARKVFEHDLAGTIETVAKDVKLQIEFNPENVKQYRLIGYENRKLQREDFDNDRIDAGEIGAGHTVTALYELVLTNTPAAEHVGGELRYQHQEAKEEKLAKGLNSELAFLKVRFKEPQGDVSKLLTFPIAQERVQADLSRVSEDFHFVNAVSAFAHKLRGSAYAPRVSFQEIVDEANRGMTSSDSEGLRREFIELVKNLSATDDSR